MIGKQGLRIKEIQRSCDVEIVTPPKGENYFTIFGKRDNIRQAKEAINKITQQYITREMGKEKNENEKNQREEKYRTRPEIESDKYQSRDIRFHAEVPTKIQLTTYESGYAEKKEEQSWNQRYPYREKWQEYRENVPYQEAIPVTRPSQTYSQGKYEKIHPGSYQPQPRYEEDHQTTGRYSRESWGNKHINSPVMTSSPRYRSNSPSPIRTNEKEIYRIPPDVRRYIPQVQYVWKRSESQTNSPKEGRKERAEWPSGQETYEEWRIREEEAFQAKNEEMLDKMNQMVEEMGEYMEQYREKLHRH